MHNLILVVARGSRTFHDLSQGCALKSVLQVSAIFGGAAFFLHFVWEMWQLPFYEAMVDARHGDVVWLCTRAAGGDALIAIAAYALAALMTRDPGWIQSPDRLSMAVYLGIGLAATVFFEYVAVEILHRWQYADAMPLLPLIGTGIVPMAQWVVVPLATLWLARIVQRGLRDGKDA